MLHRLRDVDWKAASRTFGNAHASLIGLVVSWWNQQEDSFAALDEAPSFRKGEGWVGARRCDAVLMDESGPAWILEVEGTKHEDCLDKMAEYFGSPDFGGVKGGILLAYTTGPKGSGDGRDFPPPATETLNKMAQRITTASKGKTIVLVFIKKDYERHPGGIRDRTEYYAGRVSRIWANAVTNGNTIGSAEFWIHSGQQRSPRD